jgi:hypothetical protein
MAKDCHGRLVHVGAKVKLLRIDQRLLAPLKKKERIDVESMLGEILEVYDVRGQLVCVEKSWSRGRGKTEYHMLSVDGADVEVVEPRL